MKIFAFDLLAYAETSGSSQGGQGAALSGERSRFRDLPIADLERNHGLPWGRPEEVRDKLIAEAEAVGANTMLLNFNRGAMPHAMFMEQLRRFGAEVLPALQAHPVTKVPV